MEQSGDIPEQENCVKVAERKLEMLVKEAPASLVYGWAASTAALRIPAGMWTLLYLG